MMMLETLLAVGGWSLFGYLLYRAFTSRREV
jgi:hypothetical protein